MTSTDDPPPRVSDNGHLPALAGVSHPTIAVLVGLLLVRTALLFAADAIAFGIGRALDPATTWDEVLIWSNVSIVLVDIITIALVAVTLKKSGSGLGALLRTRTPGRDIAWGLLMVVIVYIGFFITSFIGNLVAYQGAPPVSTGTFTPPLWFGLWCLIVMPVTIAVAEEVLYRGHLQHVLSARWGKVIGLIVMAVFFGIQHLALTPFDPQAWLARFVTTFLAGIMFGLLALWMKRLWPLIIGHWVLDVIGLGLPVLLASLAVA